MKFTVGCKNFKSLKELEVVLLTVIVWKL